MALQRELAAIELRTGGRGQDCPGRAAPRGSRAGPRVREAASRSGEALKARAESWASATAGPNAAGGQRYPCVDAGVGMERAVRPVPAPESDCGLQLAARPSWRQNCGGLLRSAGEPHACLTLCAHRSDGLGPNVCVNPLRAVPAWGKTAGGWAPSGGRDYAVAGALCEESGAWRVFRKNRLQRLVYGPLPLFPLPLSPWLRGGRRGRAVFAIFSPVVHVVSGGEIRPKLDGRGMQLLVQGVRLGPGRLLLPARRSEGSGGSLPFPITDLRGVPPPLSMLP